jgi:hypothetical protein
MLTFFTTAKAFEGHSGVIQRNALKSWTLLHPDIEVILFGDDKGAAEFCQELGIRHEPHVERHESGFKYIGMIFDEAQKLARHEILCYVNCDIILDGDFVHAVQKVSSEKEKFLMVGRRWDVDRNEEINFANRSWIKEVRGAAMRANCQRDEWFIDYFAFRRDLFLGRIPKLVVGRVYWDNWLLWFARNKKAALVDVSAVVMAVHQNHDYGYHPAGKTGVWNDELARRNLELAGGYKHLRAMSSANYVLTTEGIKKRSLSKRWSESALSTCRNRVWHPLLDRTRTIRHMLGLRRQT